MAPPKPKMDPNELAVVVSDDGRVQGSFQGPFARSEAEEIIKDCHGKVKHLHGAKVVTGEEARKALDKGRL